ncbi:hypothetical protein IGS61_03540 [Janthinobacterium sp. FW305-129]|uniref:imm11 family protein n=1 Tax=Janthinobacterium sp. FW305-129 TaxID=2775054 RepID=UPI001E4C0DBA|nr:DUF1629 domain-containing protein [Janthinobacterium sp. FW305-129]MCC7596546.1 hypothetical protein [Janthinobacterium sp. FW305-129]
MKKYEQQYYFLRVADDERIPSVSADDDTSDKNYDFEEFPIGSPPFMFFNAGREYNEKNGIPLLKNVPAILFDGTNLLVPGSMREVLLELNIPHLHMHPSVYIHDDGQWHEDYWYMTFVERLDCWSREKSDYEDEIQPIRLGGFEFFLVYKFCFDEELLNSMPQSERLLFKMGGALNALIVCHESILDIFKLGDVHGIKFIKVEDY